MLSINKFLYLLVSIQSAVSEAIDKHLVQFSTTVPYVLPSEEGSCSRRADNDFKCGRLKGI